MAHPKLIPLNKILKDTDQEKLSNYSKADADIESNSNESNSFNKENPLIKSHENSSILSIDPKYQGINLS